MKVYQNLRKPIHEEFSKCSVYYILRACKKVSLGIATDFCTVFFKYYLKYIKRIFIYTLNSQEVTLTIKNYTQFYNTNDIFIKYHNT